MLDAIAGYKLRFESQPVQTVTPQVSHSSPKEFVRMANAIQALLRKGAIEQCTPLPDQFLSPYFLAQKSDGSDRFILNLKELNEFLTKDHFKIEDFRMAVQLVFPGYHMCTLDLTDAFFLIPVFLGHRKFLRFTFNKITYQFCCLPFGLCQCPFVFTKVLKPVVRYLRSLGFSLIIYLDDFFLIEDSFEACTQSVKTTISVLESLGFLINYEKSQRIPKTTCKFLGFLIDSVKYRIDLPDEKRKNIRLMANKLIATPSCKIEFLAQFIGKLVAYCPAVEYGWLHVKMFEKAKIEALIRTHDDYKSHTSLPDYVFEDLHWWRSNIDQAHNPIKTYIFHKTIFTDASLTGWGATDGSREIHGFWSPEEASHSINFLELLTVKLALAQLANNLQNCQILVRCDNSTALAYINKMGGTRCSQLHLLARDIWNWAQERKIFIIASYIPSEDNKRADALSRIVNPDTEWCLADYAFQEIVNTLGKPDVDLFANPWNTKCPIFVSRFPELGASSVDAFTQNWSGIYFYAFPPFSMILRTLTKIRHEQAEGIIVVPNWPTQPWFPILQRMIHPGFLIFPSAPDLLTSVNRGMHPQAHRLSVMAGRISYRP